MFYPLNSLRYLIEPRSILFGDFVTSYVLDLLSVLKDVDDHFMTSTFLNCAKSSRNLYVTLFPFHTGTL